MRTTSTPAYTTKAQRAMRAGLNTLHSCGWLFSRTLRGPCYDMNDLKDLWLMCRYAISAGLGWYLKYTCNASVSWGRGASGNNVALPSPGQLPLPTPQTQLASVQWRYAYNVCTYGYSMAWWNFTQFEEEIDRLALWGAYLLYE